MAVEGFKGGEIRFGQMLSSKDGMTSGIPMAMSAVTSNRRVYGHQIQSSR